MYYTKERLLESKAELTEEQAKYLADLINADLKKHSIKMYGVKDKNGFYDWQDTKVPGRHYWVGLLVGWRKMGLFDEPPVEFEQEDVDPTGTLEEELQYAKNQLEVKEKVITKLRGSSIIKVPPQRTRPLKHEVKDE